MYANMPNTDTASIRIATRRIKTHIANRYLKLADKVDAEEALTEKERETYEKLTTEFARNVVPRSQEVSGEDGGALQVSLVKYADNSTALPIPTSELSASIT